LERDFFQERKERKEMKRERKRERERDEKYAIIYIN